MNLRRREPCNWRESVVSTENCCVWEPRELMQRTVDICSYLSSHSTSASVSELSRLVTHTAVSSSKCNSENRPLCYNVAFRTLFKWHRYCGILKIHIVRKINTGIRYEPVYRPALAETSTTAVVQCVRWSQMVASGPSKALRCWWLWTELYASIFPHGDVLVLEKLPLCALSDEGWSLKMANYTAVLSLLNATTEKICHISKNASLPFHF